MPNAISIALPIESRRTAHDFYRAAFGFETVGEPDRDGMPEPLQFALDTHTRLTLVPTGGLEWVVGKGRLAPAGKTECLLTLTEPTPSAVRERVQKCTAAGASVVSEPSRKDWGFEAIVADPDGHLWMIVADTH